MLVPIVMCFSQTVERILILTATLLSTLFVCDLLRLPLPVRELPLLGSDAVSVYHYSFWWIIFRYLLCTRIPVLESAQAPFHDLAASPIPVTQRAVTLSAHSVRRSERTGQLNE